jgi:hypothetical protein
MTIFDDEESTYESIEFETDEETDYESDLYESDNESLD